MAFITIHCQIYSLLKSRRLAFFGFQPSFWQRKKKQHKTTYNVFWEVENGKRKFILKKQKIN